MTGPAREIWKRIIKSLQAEYFSNHHLDLLRAYCEAAARHKQATREIGKQGAVIVQANGVMKANPWCAIETAAASTMAQIGTKLGITRNSTTTRREKTKTKKTGSRFGDLIGGSNSS